MGLEEILDITEQTQPGPQGQLQRVFLVRFSTENTSGAFSVEVPEDEFSPEMARQRAEERAQELDDAFMSEG